MPDDDVNTELERLRAENAQLKRAANRGVSLKVSETGGVSVYGLGRFPVTLYKEQWTDAARHGRRHLCVHSGQGVTAVRYSARPGGVECRTINLSLR